MTSLILLIRTSSFELRFLNIVWNLIFYLVLWNEIPLCLVQKKEKQFEHISNSTRYSHRYIFLLLSSYMLFSCFFQGEHFFKSVIINHCLLYEILTVKYGKYQHFTQLLWLEMALFSKKALQNIEKHS